MSERAGRGGFAASDWPCPGLRPLLIALFFLFFLFRPRATRPERCVWRRLSSMASRLAHHHILPASRAILACWWVWVDTRQEIDWHGEGRQMIINEGMFLCSPGVVTDRLPRGRGNRTVSLFLKNIMINKRKREGRKTRKKEKKEEKKRKRLILIFLGRGRGGVGEAAQRTCRVRGQGPRNSDERFAYALPKAA